MTVAAFRKHCLALPGATYDVKWGKDHCYSVGGKMFAVFGDKTFSFKVDDNRFLELTDRKGVIPAPYMAKHKWVLLENAKALPADDVKALLTRSHDLVAAKLPKKVQAALK
jgi:predicted DNA-binding protein (MmcQ/YjbR family)